MFSVAAFFCYNRLNMLQKLRFLIPLGVLLLLVVLAAWAFWPRQITLVVDGQPQTLMVSARTVGDALHAAGLPLRSGDELNPPAGSWLASGTIITLDRARPVSILFNGIPLALYTGERLPENLLAQAGVPWIAEDQLFLDGQRILPGQPLPPAAQYTLTVRPAVEVTLRQDGQTRVLKTAAATLGQALWEAGIRVQPGDRLSLPSNTPLASAVQVDYIPAVPLTVRLRDRDLQIRTAAKTIGQALSEAGISLQGLDYSEPSEDSPVKPGGTVRVVRVREEVVLQQTTIPFKSEYKPDSSTDIDTRSIITPGRYGLKVARERVRYENGQETARQKEAEWVASDPIDQVVGLGTRLAEKTLNTPDGKIKYYRAVTVYATSYSPCRQGLGKCSKSTSSGIPLRKGIVAVTLPWYNQFAGSRVYIPGYGIGVIADVGGGIPGRKWIDLGYDEENFENWHQNVTLYFLAPAPANVPWNLP